MTPAWSIFTVPFRHGCWRVFPHVLFAIPLCASNPSLSIQVSSETAPPGGYAQFKVYAAPPALISTANIIFNFDPAIFGPVVAVNAFSATGDQTGSVQRAVNFQTGAETEPIYVTSASSSLGQLPDLPIFIVTVPVLAIAKIGATSTVSGDPTTFPWKDQNQNAYIVTVNSGTFIVGGTLSIQNVTPGGGLLPSGAVVAIDGTGFDVTTRVSIDGVSIASTQVVSPQRVNLTLGGATEIAGKHLHLSNAAGAAADFFPSLNVQSVILPSLPALPYTAVSWNYSQGGAFFVAYDCLLNSNPFPVTATYYDAEYERPVTIESVVIPPYGLYIGPPADLPLGLGALYMTLSAPIRMTTLNVTFGSAAGPNPVGAYPPAQMTSLGQLTPSGGGPSIYSWNWQIGTPAPQPQMVLLLSSLPFTVTLTGGAADWLKVTPTSGGGITNLTFQPVVTSLGAGSYTGTVVLTPQLPPDLAQFGPGSSSFNVAITVSAQPTLVYTAGDMVFRASPGGAAPASMTIPVTSNGTPAAFTTSIAGGSWLSVTPASGTTPATLTLTANPAGLPAGEYSLDLFIKGPVNTEVVPVSLGLGSIVSPVQISPSGLGFNLMAGQGPAPPQTVNVTSLSPVSLTTTPLSGSNWLSALLVSSNLIQLTATAVNLSPGTYQSVVTVTSTANAGADILATLVVYPSDPGQFTVSPSNFHLVTSAGTPAIANVQVTASSGSPLFTVSQTTGPIQVAPGANQYIAPATVQFSTTTIIPGSYQASITLNWTGGSVSIPITITVVPSTGPPMMDAIVSSGSALPGSIAPGELISIFGLGLGTTPMSLQLTANDTVATILNGTQVLINGVAAPLVYSSPSQVNAIVPYEVSGASTATIQAAVNGLPTGTWAIPVAPSAPSIFTAASSGAGQAAVVNGDGSVNSASNPASRGGVIQIYATGGGQTSPLSSTGAVAQSSASLSLPVSATIGGVSAQVLYAGNAPGEAEGVVQLNVVVPQSVAPGAAVPVLVTIGGTLSQASVTVAIQ